MLAYRAPEHPFNLYLLALGNKCRKFQNDVRYKLEILRIKDVQLKKC